ncbi:OmpA family protein [Pelagibius marinus]|uniref:OmpA family protein n=1 Tax=Pelagibius marinus TaxID=2762760 RepID=UPI0018721810|nr:OmpA family protein [Pelagibius marinus]
MNRTIRIFLAAAGLALLSGCAGFGLQEAQMVPQQGNAFDRALSSGYLDLSQKEFDEADYIDSDRFAERSMAAARGESVQPEEIAARELPSNKVGTLTGARERLVTALSGGAAGRQPADAAEAQVSFDCWMQEQEENFQLDDIAACQNRFIAAMERLEPKPMAAPAPPPPPPAPAPMALPGPFVVYFDFDSAALTPQAQTELADVVEAAGKTGEGAINITGYTDLSGAEAYNQVLSERRANSVIELLVGSGVDAARIVGRGLGEANPVVMTEAPEQRNRRVEIEFQR